MTDAPKTRARGNRSVTSMTTGEADAWRAGWRAARDAIAAAFVIPPGTSVTLGDYGRAEGLRRDILAMEPPA